MSICTMSPACSHSYRWTGTGGAAGRRAPDAAARHSPSSAARRAPARGPTPAGHGFRAAGGSAPRSPRASDAPARPGRTSRPRGRGATRPKAPHPFADGSHTHAGRRARRGVGPALPQHAVHEQPARSRGTSRITMELHPGSPPIRTVGSRHHTFQRAPDEQRT